jgi:hypothetical protein
VRVLRYLWPAPWSLLGLLAGGLVCLLGGQCRVVAGTLEFSGGRLGRWAHGGVGPFAVTAFTLGHVVVGNSAAMLDALRAHEQVHVRQYERWGVFFVPAYLASSLWCGLTGRHVYRDNAFERPAFAAEVQARLAQTRPGASA